MTPAEALECVMTARSADWVDDAGVFHDRLRTLGFTIVPVEPTDEQVEASGPYRVLDLFSGIGGFSLGLERTGGFRTAAFCEIDPYCQAVLRKHWPGVPIYDDVRTLTADRLAADGIGPVDVITGGFPCQDISVAGKMAGLDGERSGLWSEIARLVGELRPRFVIVENVANLLAGPPERPGGWFGRVLGDLACLGYDAEWENIPAAAVGAPHRRERIWLVAYAHGDDDGDRSGEISRAAGTSEGATQRSHGERVRPKPRASSQDVAHADDLHGEGFVPGHANAQERSVPDQRQARSCGDGGGWWASEPDVGGGPDGLSGGLDGGRGNGAASQPWGPNWESGIARVAHAVPARAHRLRALGNAVVPQIPELIGRSILDAYA